MKIHNLFRCFKTKFYKGLAKSFVSVYLSAVDISRHLDYLCMKFQCTLFCETVKVRKKYISLCCINLFSHSEQWNLEKNIIYCNEEENEMKEVNNKTQCFVLKKNVKRVEKVTLIEYLFFSFLPLLCDNIWTIYVITSQLWLGTLPYQQSIILHMNLFHQEILYTVLAYFYEGLLYHLIWILKYILK